MTVSDEEVEAAWIALVKQHTAAVHLTGRHVRAALEAAAKRREDDGYVIRGFMDGIDWQHELGNARGGNTVHPSVKDVKESHPCVVTGGCGVVEVEVRMVRWVEEQNLKYESEEHILKTIISK